MNIEDLNNCRIDFNSSLDPSEDVTYTKIEDYVLQSLNIDSLTSVDPDIFQHNFTYLMCNVIKDIREIEIRLKEYSSQYNSINAAKGLDSEYKRRKIKYFCDINKEAHKEICSFLSNKIVEILLDTKYDMLKREDEKDLLSAYRHNWRYRYALHRIYYSYDFPFDVSAKLDGYVKLRYKFKDWLDREKMLMERYFSDPNVFWDNLYKYVDNYKMMNVITKIVQNNYHLSRRRELFETLNELWSNKKYMSFITLGLIQIEGLFDDYCRIKFGNQDQGTLIEKAHKSLENNDFLFFKMYPYFAFDIPQLRNEVAHTGMIKTKDVQKTAYNLVLDLNTLTRIVHIESFEKFSSIESIFDDLLEAENISTKDEFYEKLIHELFYSDMFLSEYFLKILKSPIDYEDELNFYKKENLEEGYIDLPSIVEFLSTKIKSEDFWSTLHRLCSETSDCVELMEFAKRMKNQYISILDGNAKTECIEVAKLVG